MRLILKIPIAYVGWVVWWAIKAEPEAGVEGGSEGISWRPRRHRPAGVASSLDDCRHQRPPVNPSLRTRQKCTTISRKPMRGRAMTCKT